MIGGLLLILLGVAGAMQAPVWAVPLVALVIGLLCGGVPFLGERLSRPLSWAVIAVLATAAYGLGYWAGLLLIG